MESFIGFIHKSNCKNLSCCYFLIQLRFSPLSIFAVHLPTFLHYIFYPVGVIRLFVLTFIFTFGYRHQSLCTDYLLIIPEFPILSPFFPMTISSGLRFRITHIHNRMHIYILCSSFPSIILSIGLFLRILNKYIYIYMYCVYNVSTSLVLRD